jgi:hypothetical protein
MPDDVMQKYTARQIAEVMAYYRIKSEDRENEEAQAEWKKEVERRRREGSKRRY